MYIVVEDLLPDIKQQIEDYVVGWLCQSLAIIQVAIQFTEELKTSVLVLQIITRTEMGFILFYQSSNLPYLP